MRQSNICTVREKLSEFEQQKLSENIGASTFSNICSELINLSFAQQHYIKEFWILHKYYTSIFTQFYTSIWIGEKVISVFRFEKFFRFFGFRFFP